MTYGYFVAATRERHGDHALALVAESMWNRTGHTSPGRFDGVSVWQGDEGPRTIRYVMRDIFTMRTIRYGKCAPFQVPATFVRDFALRISPSNGNEQETKNG